ncbi:hypothetical protein H257_15434 [Aphanomyces astaci]|uniref:DDE-1 domain-containing protein n=1 Tax=Aphanomyces astaci TaxID=112090 RepID=W4FP83_APHAT|nr:hypothetical protein H257_15434 [Aphanomyces astaci]ETV68624.1 hypothetical protein H257_15434 [Aphanomyces astaci]|eukprot:XP_009841849.1 hypothetical protein H257_15434 [Aphanomyces astaci]
MIAQKLHAVAIAIDTIVQQQTMLQQSRSKARKRNTGNSGAKAVIPDPHLRELWVLTPITATTAERKRIAMIDRAIRAWDMISEDEVRASFVKALPEEIQI